MEEPKKVARRDHKTKAAKEPKEDIESWFLSAKSINCRCRLSAVRDVLDKVRPTIPEETWTTLKAMNLVQFFDLPPYSQDHILTMHILNCWNIDQTVFILGGKEVRFDADQVALLIGMPNRGAPAYWNKLPSCCVTARQIKSDLVNVSLGESSIPFEELLLKFLVTNLLFSSSNFNVPQELYSFYEDVQSFSSYNWPVTVCDFLIEQVNAYAMKIRRKQPLGYINGFVFLLTLWFYEHTSLVVPAVPEARPRMLRWPSKVCRNASNIHLAFKRLKPEQIFMDMSVLVEALGKMLDNIESQVANAVNHVQKDTESLQTAKSFQNKSRKCIFIAIIVSDNYNYHYSLND